MYKTLILILGCSLLPSCKKEVITQYSIPKEKSLAPMPASGPPMASNMQELPGLAQQTEAFKIPTWVAPEYWTPKTLGAMRKGSFLIKKKEQQAEVSVLVFPGDVGGKEANINRWAAQLGLEALSLEEVKALEHLTVDSLDATIVFLVGPEQSIYGAIIEREKESWFFKMMGDIELVASEKESFRAFLQSVKFQDS